MAQRDKLEILYLRMRFFGPTALIGLSLGVLGASAASADQCPKKESPIATDPPDVTNSSLVLPPGSFQNENGINFSQRNGGHQFDGTNSRLRWGIVPCFEVLPDIPAYFAPTDGPLNSGFNQYDTSGQIANQPRAWRN
jgi:hypothetical protein